jgi:hypothetical protein
MTLLGWREGEWDRVTVGIATPASATFLLTDEQRKRGDPKKEKGMKAAHTQSDATASNRRGDRPPLNKKLGHKRHARSKHHVANHDAGTMEFNSHLPPAASHERCGCLSTKRAGQREMKLGSQMSASEKDNRKD